LWRCVLISSLHDKFIVMYMSLRICPRCGKPYSWIEKKRPKNGSRVYYYAVHVFKDPETGKRTVKRCYLGPEEYVYVSMLHVREGLTLKGLRDSQRALEYLDALIAYLQSVELDDALRRSLGVRFMRIGRILLGLEPDIGEISEILRYRTGFVPVVYRAVEVQGRRILEISTPGRAKSEEVCRVLAEYGYSCRVSEDGLKVYVGV